MMLPNHIPVLNGFKKIHIFLIMSWLTGTSIPTPDSVYGMVKSTYNVLLYLTVISLTAMSIFCNGINSSQIKYLKIKK
jgi:hypothetical protein